MLTNGLQILKIDMHVTGYSTKELWRGHIIIQQLLTSVISHYCRCKKMFREQVVVTGIPSCFSRRQGVVFNHEIRTRIWHAHVHRRLGPLLFWGKYFITVARQHSYRLSTMHLHFSCWSKPPSPASLKSCTGINEQLKNRFLGKLELHLNRKDVEGSTRNANNHLLIEKTSRQSHFQSVANSCIYTRVSRYLRGYPKTSAFNT